MIDVLLAEAVIRLISQCCGVDITGMINFTYFILSEYILADRCIGRMFNDDDGQTTKFSTNC